MQYTASTINRTALPRSKRMRALGAASVTPTVVPDESGDKYWNGEIDTETEETEVSTTYPIKISKRLRIVDESGALHGDISIDANGRFVFDKGIISKEDIIAYGVGGEDVKSVTDVIEEYLSEHGVGGGGLSSVVITSSGSGNVVSGMSKTLSDDGKTLTLTLTKGISAYVKPSTGIPLTDLASSVQTSLEKADTALQEHQSLQGYATEQWVEGKGYLTTHQSLAVERYNFSTASNVSIKQPIYTLSAVNHLNWGSQNNALIDKGALAYWNGRYNGQSSNLLYFKNGEIDSVSARNTAITNAINALDVTSVGGDGKYIQSISQTDGKISATAGTLDKTAVGLGNVNNTADANKNVEGANHILSLGKETMITGTTKPTKTGISLVEVYNNGYPSPYGNIINVRGQGSGQLLCGWTDSNATGHLKYRSLRDTVDGWSDWKTVAFTDDNVASATKLATARTLWGQSFDGTGNVNGAISDTGNITPTATATSSIGSLSLLYASIYANALHGNADNMYITNTKADKDISFWTNNSTTGNNVERMRISGLNGNVAIGTSVVADQKLRVNGVIRGIGQAMFDGVNLNGNTITRLTNVYYNGSATEFYFLKSGNTARTRVLGVGYDGSGQFEQIGMPTATGNSRVDLRNNKGQNRLLVGTNGAAYLATDFEDDTAWSNNKVYLLNNNAGHTMLATTTTRNSATADRTIYIRPSGLTSSTNQSTFKSTGVTINGSSADTLVIKRTAANSGAFINFYANNQSTNYWRIGSNGSNKCVFAYNGAEKMTIETNGDITSVGNILATSGESASDRYVSVFNSNGGVRLYTSTNRGLYDATLGKWIINTIKADSTVGINGGKVTIDNNGNLVATGDVTAYSDVRLKTEIKPLEYRGPLEPKTYIKDGKKAIGFIAQEVRELYPELVLGEEKEDEYLSLNYGGITAVLAAENKELRSRIEKLETLINKLIEEK